MHACNSANDKPVDQLARISSTKRRGREGGREEGREKESRSNRCTREREKGVNSCEGIGGVQRGKDRKRRIACIYARRAKGRGWWKKVASSRMDQRKKHISGGKRGCWRVKREKTGRPG